LNKDFHTQPELPKWARVDLFKPKPLESEPYGVISKKGETLGCSSIEELDQLFRENGGGRVWVPDSPLLMVPEGVPDLLEAVREVSSTRANKELQSALIQLGIIGVLIAFVVFPHLNDLSLLLEDPKFGMLGVALLMFGVIPTYEAWKMKRVASTLNAEKMRALANESRFEIWMETQKSPVTKIAILLIMSAYVLQYAASKENEAHRVIEAVGLNKPAYKAGEYWRLLTAPFLHAPFPGGIVHILFNASALWFLGKRTEVMVNWPHFVLVFLMSILSGGVVSAMFYDTTSVGASGGIMGLLGFLIVFESLHIKLVPKPSRRRLFSAVLGMVLIGIVGFRFIDNGAHGGGLLAGMIYALLVFPRSSSAHRPKANKTDFAVGSIAGVILLIGFLMTIQKLLV